MTTTTDDSDETAEPIADRVHDNSWSANLEEPKYADDPELTVRDALAAVDHTTSGNHVNLVTHGDLGRPEEFLYDALREERDGLEPTYVERCGCGGHVTRVAIP